MSNLTTIEQLVLENVEKKGAVVLTEDLFDFEDFDRQEFPLVERALNTLADKHKKYAVLSRLISPSFRNRRLPGVFWTGASR